MAQPTLTERQEDTFPTTTQRRVFDVCGRYSALDRPLLSSNKTASTAITLNNFNIIFLRHPFHIHIHNAYNPHSTPAECQEHTFPTISQRWCFAVCSWYSALDCPLVSGNKTASAAIAIINFNIFLRHPYIYFYIHNAYKYTVYNVTDPYSNTYILYVLSSVDIISEKVISHIAHLRHPGITITQRLHSNNATAEGVWAFSKRRGQCQNIAMTAFISIFMWRSWSNVTFAVF